jgi:hypothetical protein
VTAAASLALDHLVVAARTLAEGVAWCEATLGITPGAGGNHPLMGTHNRLFSIASARFPRAYFEIIAIDPAAPASARRRWFDLDDPALRSALDAGPQLVHWVARCDAIDSCCRDWAGRGIERGAPIAASRETPQGLLRWRISVRDDGARLFDGALPTLIEWGTVHPADAMPSSGIVLESLALGGLPDNVRPLLAIDGVALDGAAPMLRACLTTPQGPSVVLQAPLLSIA